MCPPKPPAPQKTPPPPKKGLKAAEIADVEAVSPEGDTLAAKSSGLEKLRIALTSPAANLDKDGAGVQTGT